MARSLQEQPVIQISTNIQFTNTHTYDNILRKIKPDK